MALADLLVGCGWLPGSLWLAYWLAVADLLVGCGWLTGQQPDPQQTHLSRGGDFMSFYQVT
jgi:hypothetical protein